jgi:hypothetical protein
MSSSAAILEENIRRPPTKFSATEERIMTAALKGAPANEFPFDRLTVGLENSVREKYILIDAIGLSSPIAQRIVGKLNQLFDVNRHEIEPWFALWHEHCDYYFDVPAAEDILSAEVVSIRQAPFPCSDILQDSSLRACAFPSPRNPEAQTSQQPV